MERSVNVAVQLLTLNYEGEAYAIIDKAILEIKNSGLLHRICPFKITQPPLDSGFMYYGMGENRSKCRFLEIIIPFFPPDPQTLHLYNRLRVLHL